MMLSTFYENPQLYYRDLISFLDISLIRYKKDGWKLIYIESWMSLFSCDLKR